VVAMLCPVVLVKGQDVCWSSRKLSEPDGVPEPQRSTRGSALVSEDENDKIK